MLRPIKESLLLRFSSFLGRFITPNKMTIISLCIGIISAGAILRGYKWIGLVFWVLNRTTDGLDGTIARATGKQSDFGGYIDIMSDFIIYAIIPIAFVLNRGFIRYEALALVIMLATFYINSASWMYLSSIIEKRNLNSKDSLTSVNMPKGLAEGFETIIIYTLFFILPQNIIVLFLILAILSLLGSCQRVLWAKKVLK